MCDDSLIVQNDITFFLLLGAKGRDGAARGDEELREGGAISMNSDTRAEHGYGYGLLPPYDNRSEQ